MLKRGLFTLFLAFALGTRFSASLPAESLPEGDSAGGKILLSEAARHFGVVTSWRPAEGKLSFIFGEHSAQILIGSDRLMVDDYLMFLTSPVAVNNGSVSMPLSDSAELFSRLLGREVSEEELVTAGLTSRRAFVSRRSVESVRYISYPRFTRLIVNVSGFEKAEDVDVVCIEDARSLTIEFPGMRFFQLSAPIDVKDSIVDMIEPIQTSSHAKLIVRTVPGKIKYELQKYDDPQRIVVDITTAEPTIVTNFKESPALSPQPDGWVEPEHPRQREQFLLTTIVIDPGHGGKDLGARGRGGLAEKDVTLDIAFRLKELIESEPGMKVVLTRTGDYFVSLEERTKIANSAKDGGPADLFISVHTNSHKSPRISGFEAYYISDAIDPSAEATAALENAVIELEREVGDQLGDSLAPILWDLQFTEFISESSELAFMTQKELDERLDTRNRGVRQAKFIVLAGVAMPSVLIEVGFISNRVEEAKLSTGDFRDKCAEALAAAVASFKERHDVRLGLLKEKAGP